MSDGAFLMLVAAAALLVIPILHVALADRVQFGTYLVVLGVLVALLVVGALAVRAEAQRRHRHCDYPWRHDVRGRALVIRCWAERRGLDPNKAIRVALCEAGPDFGDFYWRDGYAGPFQQAVRYWAARARVYGAPGRPATSVWANAKVSTGMARDRGWTGGDWPRCGWA